MSEYIYDPAWEQERERLRGLEEQNDPGSIAAIEGRGIAEGWRCLEVGAGGGSIAEWLCDRVGASGHVVATDLDTRFVEAIDKPNLTVLKHDIVAGPPDGAQFDLVHSRAMIAHIPERERAVANMVASVRPGGWLVLEDVDFSTMGPAEPSDAFRAVRDGMVAMMRTTGVDPYCGRRVTKMLMDAGLVDVAGAGRVFVVDDEAPRVATLTLDALGPRGVAAGFIRAEDLEAVRAQLASKDVHLISPVMWAAWGRVPG